jgi:phenylalanyl-tRNA synthetase beta chain
LEKATTIVKDMIIKYGMDKDIGPVYYHSQERDEYNLAKLECKEDCDKLSVKVENNKDCSRYMVIAMNGIKIKKSPKWMQEKLLAIGMKSINNIVDITNYVMFEIGQPMHAFDRAQVDKIIVRRAKKGETIETLDGEERKLDENMILIADSKKSLAVAGVMGGVNSEINNETEEIIFEAATFDFVSVRKTSNKLSLRTDSSSRFEKGLDPNMCEKALVRAVELVEKIIPGAKVSSKLVDEKKFDLNLGPVEIEIDWFSKILGIDIEKKKILSYLSSLGFNIEDMDAVDQVYTNFFPEGVPARSTVGVAALPNDALIQIDAVVGNEEGTPPIA